MITECAYAKINLGIDVKFLRDDGYHEVDMIMQSVDLCDTVMIEENRSGDIDLFIASDDPGIDVSALPVDGQNLCQRAAKLIMGDKGIDKGIDIFLIKRIPFEAGLGGGSSDAAAVLRALNSIFDMGYSTDELMSLGAKIGADVPFCVMGGTARLKGTGEIYEPISPAFSEVPILLAGPGFGISTADIYHAIDNVADPVHADIDALEAAVISGCIESVSDCMSNMLEDAAIPGYPKINDIKREIKELGAAGALMTGSGSTVFGVFEREEAAWSAALALKKRHPEWFIKAALTGV